MNKITWPGPKQVAKEMWAVAVMAGLVTVICVFADAVSHGVLSAILNLL